MTGKQLGYVYILKAENSSPLKIGYTNQSIDRRLQELNTTAIIDRLKPIYYIGVEDAYAVEQLTHRNLTSFRIDLRREFFSCAVQTAISEIEDSAKALGLKILSKWVNADSVSNIKEDNLLFPEFWNQETRRNLLKAINNIERESESYLLNAKLLTKSAPEKLELKDTENIIDWMRKASGFLGEFIHFFYRSGKLDEINLLLQHYHIQKAKEEASFILDRLFKSCRENPIYKEFESTNLRTIKYIKDNALCFIDVNKYNAFMEVFKTNSKIMDSELTLITTQLLEIKEAIKHRPTPSITREHFQKNIATISEAIKTAKNYFINTTPRELRDELWDTEEDVFLSTLFDELEDVDLPTSLKEHVILLFPVMNNINNHNYLDSFLKNHFTDLFIEKFGRSYANSVVSSLNDLRLFHDSCYAEFFKAETIWLTS